MLTNSTGETEHDLDLVAVSYEPGSDADDGDGRGDQRFAEARLFFPHASPVLVVSSLLMQFSVCKMIKGGELACDSLRG